jgi:hypothetical protein
MTRVINGPIGLIQLKDAKGNGHFALFAFTVKYLLDPQFVDIDIKIDG